MAQSDEPKLQIPIGRSHSGLVLWDGQHSIEITRSTKGTSNIRTFRSGPVRGIPVSFLRLWKWDASDCIVGSFITLKINELHTALGEVGDAD